MPLGTTTYGDINPETAGYLSKVFLTRALTLMAFEQFVSGKTLPGNETKLMRFRRYIGDNNFALANMYLTEGVVPNAQQVTMQDVTVTLRQMGGLMKLTDVIQDTHTDPVLNQMIMIQGEQAPRMVELDRWYALRALTNKYYDTAGHTSRATVNSTVTAGLLKKVIRNLERNIAVKITRMAKTSPDFNTESVNPSYIAICHTDLRNDLEAIPGFTLVKDYPSNVKVYEGECGAFSNVRFILTTETVPYSSAGAAAVTNGMISTDGTNTDVYPIFFFGQMAWDSVALKGKFAVTPMVVNPNTVSHSNPLGQFGFVSWKTMQGTVILNDTWAVLVEVGATELT